MFQLLGDGVQHRVDDLDGERRGEVLVEVALFALGDVLSGLFAAQVCAPVFNDNPVRPLVEAKQ